eukprot:TRINITY_DN46978_c0_g1_i1.p1 TRINITY_DN46978_c0_g1~~TRINITY_DN46978_c0_g1_i1.p1  ORF type:complete len:450 (+),score=118.82 TRINITY_DN46978_c0_g1_i1:85-1434(+)
MGERSHTLAGLGTITCHACILDPYCVDQGLFDLFVRGENARDAMVRLRKSAKYAHAPEHLIEDDINDHYRMFHYLLHYLQRPHFFLQSCPVPLDRSVRMSLLARYFQLDTRLCTDIYGRKPKDLRSRALADRYQVENVRLIYKQVIKEQGPAVDWGGGAAGVPQPTTSGTDHAVLEDAIMSHFKLPRALAQTYAALCFSIKWNLHIEKHRKLPAFRSWENLQIVTASVMRQFCSKRSTLTPGLEESLKSVKDLLRDAVLDAYVENIVSLLTPPGPRAPALPAKAAKVVRASIAGLAGFAANLGSKLSSLYSLCDTLNDEARILEDVQRHGAIALLEAALQSPLSDRPTKKGKVLTERAKHSWFAFLRIVLLVVQFLDSQGDTRLQAGTPVSAAGPLGSTPESTPAMSSLSPGDVASMHEAAIQRSLDEVSEAITVPASVPPLAPPHPQP